MTHSVEAALARLQVHALTAGVKHAPTRAPEAAAEFPFSLVYEQAGEIDFHDATFSDDLVTLVVEFHVARGILAESVARAYGLRTAFLRALHGDPTLNGAVSTITAVRRRFGSMEYGNTQTIGYRFEVDCTLFLEQT